MEQGTNPFARMLETEAAAEPNEPAKPSATETNPAARAQQPPSAPAHARNATRHDKTESSQSAEESDAPACDACTEDAAAEEAAAEAPALTLESTDVAASILDHSVAEEEASELAATSDILPPTQEAVVVAAVIAAPEPGENSTEAELGALATADISAANSEMKVATQTQGANVEVVAALPIGGDDDAGNEGIDPANTGEGEGPLAQIKTRPEALTSPLEESASGQPGTDQRRGDEQRNIAAVEAHDKPKPHIAPGKNEESESETDASQPVTHQVGGAQHANSESKVIPGLTSHASVQALSSVSTSPAPITITNTPAVPVSGLAVEIAVQSRAGKNRFEIRLDPPELGRIDVRLDVDKEGQVTSRLIVERVETLELLRRDAPQLERALQDAGLKTSGNALEFSLRDQSQRQNAQEARPDATTNATVIVSDEQPMAEAVRGYGRLLGLGRGLDIHI